jgi:poly-gamma-glutamate synthesis protein (capsule biosynthesis protein)
MNPFLQKYWKIIVGIALALAVLFGLSQRKFSPELGSNTRTFQNSGSQTLESFQGKASEAAGSQNKTTITFLAAGDIMLSRNVAGTIKKKNDPLLPFRNMEGVLKSTDFNFANLESPISGTDYFNPTGSMVFNAPPAYADGLQKYNFQVLNLANNHAFDQGLAGLVHTGDFLDSLGIKHMGTGKNVDEAWQPVIIDIKGIKIGFIGASFSSINDGGKATNDYVARIEDVTHLKSSILNLKSKTDFIVATMHAGTEYTHTPNAAQIAFAHAAIDAGADMVIGAHPHWIQTVETYQDKYIFYSLGNFIFDQEWSQETKEGLALKIQISKNQVSNPAAPGAANLEDLQGQRIPAKLDSVELIPVILENYSTPRPATPEETKTILNKIGQAQTTIIP